MLATISRLCMTTRSVGIETWIGAKGVDGPMDERPGTTGHQDAADEQRPYLLEVSIVGEDGATLLSLASALHRRHVEVLDARLCAADGGDRRFEATVRTTQRQVSTVAATLRNLVLVREVVVAPSVPLVTPGAATGG
jgi:hypothetical protein